MQGRYAVIQPAATLAYPDILIRCSPVAALDAVSPRG